MTITREEAEQRTILRAVVGSTVHGLNVQDGVEDRDEMGIMIEPIESVVGFSPFEQYIYRSAAEREGKPDARSRAGDLDLVIYSLRKYLRLCLGGNPTIMLPLFAPATHVVSSNAIGSQLRELVPYLVSKRAGGAFLGYLQQQRQRMMGERGQLRVNRPELVARDGYDSKYAMHMCRLGFQGIEFMQTGRLTLPMAEPERSWMYRVRQGEIPFQEMMTRAGELEQELKDAIHSSPLPDRADEDFVTRWMTDTYWKWWQSDTFATSLHGKYAPGSLA